MSQLRCDCCHQPVVYDAEAPCFHMTYYGRDCGDRGAFLHVDGFDCMNLILPYEVDDSDDYPDTARSNR